MNARVSIVYAHMHIDNIDAMNKLNLQLLETPCPLEQWFCSHYYARFLCNAWYLPFEHQNSDTNTLKHVHLGVNQYLIRVLSINRCENINRFLCVRRHTYLRKPIKLKQVTGERRYWDEQHLCAFKTPTDNADVPCEHTHIHTRLAHKLPMLQPKKLNAKLRHHSCTHSRFANTFDASANRFGSINKCS